MMRMMICNTFFGVKKINSYLQVGEGRRVSFLFTYFDWTPIYKQHVELEFI